MACVIRMQRVKALPALSSTSFMESFLHIFHEQEPLWNTKHPDYNKRNVREECYDVLVEKMQEVQPDATRDDVAKKINSFRSAFRKEYKKVVRAVEKGEVHRPRLWYYRRLLFLNGQEQQQDCEAEHVRSEEQAEDLDDETDPLIEASFQVEPHSNVEEARRPRARKRRRQTVTSTQHRCASPESHPSIFGRHVAAKLNIVADDQRLYLEKLINDAIFEAELGNLSRESRITLR